MRWLYTPAEPVSGANTAMRRHQFQRQAGGRPRGRGGESDRGYHRRGRTGPRYQPIHGLILR